ncbi:hypothetical protein C491_19769 [Natronococcus amylolyticus DSM 10524]|uniref:Uncharacterized protein n=1 Tax=Natronococcus amylolyticus DSM 10524 TaxID=1227497 RepID=L9WYE6_9EURY|nr:hypothetical protein C491_19769 [Natronococcus amylolyticus DSM 10524]
MDATAEENERSFSASIEMIRRHIGNVAIFRSRLFVAIRPTEGTNAWNSEEDGSDEYESAVSSPGAPEPTNLPEALSVLRHRTNRRILSHLLQQDEELPVERLATRIAEEQALPATDGVVKSAERNDEDTGP